MTIFRTKKYTRTYLISHARTVFVLRMAIFSTKNYTKVVTRHLLLLRTSCIPFSGFEAGGPNTPSNIDPWSIIGNESSVILSTDRSSCFELNKVALKMEVVCDNEGPNTCPPGGVGIYNPGFWGMVRTL